MELASVNTEIIDKTFPALLPATLLTRKARVMLLAIGLQESRFIYRQQVGGPARGFWQFERGGGVTGVLRHKSTAELADEVCKARGVAPTPAAVYEALPNDDLLAAAFARLLLYTDPKPLPAIDDAEGAWQYYLRNWRPGAAKRDYDGLHAKFLRNHALARAAA